MTAGGGRLSILGRPFLVFKLLISGYSMVIVAETDLVGSVTEVAVTVTLPPAGIVGGAW